MWRFYGDYKSDIVLSLKWLLDHKSPISLFMDQFEYFFSLTWKFDGDPKSDIVLSLKWLFLPQKSNFLIYGPIWIFFSSLTWKFEGVSKSDIVLSFKWLTGPQKSNFFGYLELRFYECCHSYFCIIFHSLAFWFFLKRFATYGCCQP